MCDTKKSPKRTKNGKSPKGKKDGKKKSPRKCARSRMWTNLELEAFARILADVDEEYAMKLEQMALKKSSNTHLFNEIAEKLKTIFEDEEFAIENGILLHPKDKNVPLDLTCKQLRKKYSWMKMKWKKIHDAPLKKSGIANQPVNLENSNNSLRGAKIKIRVSGRGFHKR